MTTALIAAPIPILIKFSLENGSAVSLCSPLSSLFSLFSPETVTGTLLGSKEDVPPKPFFTVPSSSCTVASSSAPPSPDSGTCVSSPFSPGSDDSVSPPSSTGSGISVSSPSSAGGWLLSAAGGSWVSCPASAGNTPRNTAAYMQIIYFLSFRFMVYSSQYKRYS